MYKKRIYKEIKRIRKIISDLLNEILVIIFGLIRKGECCMSYNLPDSAVKAIETA